MALRTGKSGDNGNGAHGGGGARAAAPPAPSLLHTAPCWVAPSPAPSPQRVRWSPRAPGLGTKAPLLLAAACAAGRVPSSDGVQPEQAGWEDWERPSSSPCWKELGPGGCGGGIWGIGSHAHDVRSPGLGDGDTGHPAGLEFLWRWCGSGGGGWRGRRGRSQGHVSGNASDLQYEGHVGLVWEVPWWALQEEYIFR